MISTSAMTPFEPAAGHRHSQEAHRIQGARQVDR
ncbi:hypothetical protein BKA25_004067 [Actinoalloteichus hymeniacidonis]|nr:hypothetical protein [Actinoalloteichus hymeniacidonis]